MIHDVLAGTGSTIWASILVVVMFLLFAAIVHSIYRGTRHRFARESRLPLDDETPHDAETHGMQP